MQEIDIKNNPSFENLETSKNYEFINHEGDRMIFSICKSEISIKVFNSEWWIIADEKERLENAIHFPRGVKFWITKFLYAIINRINK